MQGQGRLSLDLVWLLLEVIDLVGDNIIYGQLTAQMGTGYGIQGAGPDHRMKTKFVIIPKVDSL